MKGGSVLIAAAMLAVSAASTGITPAGAQPQPAADSLAWLSAKAAFEQFKEEFWPRARRAGISRRIYWRAMKDIEPLPRILERQRRQPEFSTPVWRYLEKRVTKARITRGRELLRRHGGLLSRIERIYGVDRHIILAIWGMETNYGRFRGRESVIRALATLAFTGRRQKYGRTQLIAALRILQAGDITIERMTGSWAGAMGHTQFIPTTYLGYAVDLDRDGRRDIWNSIPDALASTANYLRKRGWKRGVPWGFEVRLPRGFNWRLAGRRHARSIAAWERLGIRPARGRFYARHARAWVLLPAGHRGPAFLVTENFRAILAYNNSHAYALAVGHLADRIAGAGPLVGSWPVRDRMLTRAERIELQKMLAREGLYQGAFEGHIGPRTREAVRRFQAAAGIPPDGYVNAALLEHLRRRR
jgi:membrane-bound lytic murein transglycosylase B